MYRNIYKSDEEKVKQLLSDNGISIINTFEDTYTQVLKENVELFIFNEGKLANGDTEHEISELSGEDKNRLIEKSVNLLYDNEYLSQTINECTNDAIEGGLRELFIEKEKEEIYKLIEDGIDSDLDDLLESSYYN